jgi:hypothetical protein
MSSRAELLAAAALTAAISTGLTTPAVAAPAAPGAFLDTFGPR